MATFLNHIHYLRGVAITMIIGVHARGYSWEWQDQTGFDFFVAMFDNGTILFVFIAGFLFQHLNHEEFRYFNYLKQKLRFVVLPYILFSIPILALRLYLGSGELPLDVSFDQKPILFRVFYYLITGLHMVPFWFMPMIFLFYISSFLLHRLNSKIFYTFLFPFLLAAGLFTYRPENNANPLLSYLHFLPIYLTGMWTSYHQAKILAQKRWLLIPLALIYTFITTLELTDIISLDKRLTMESIWGERLLIFNIYVFKAIILCFILMIAFSAIQHKKNTILNSLAECSFGMYFIHFYFISLYRELFGPLSFTTVSFLAYFVVLVGISWGSIYGVKKITGRYSRYLTGS